MPFTDPLDSLALPESLRSTEVLAQRCVLGARRWILPFSRELTLGALAQAPLIPWRWKMDITHWWLKRYFYGPAGIIHMMPGGGKKAAPCDNDYAGSLQLPVLPFCP